MDFGDYRRSDLRDFVVCSACVEEPDLEKYISCADGDLGCSFCDQHDAPTCEFMDLMTHIKSCLEGEYDLAANWLPYESAEGGWQSDRYWDTPDLITDQLGIGLPRDENGVLLQAMVDGLGGLEDWCEHDPYGEDELDALRAGWERFCQLLKYETLSAVTVSDGAAIRISDGRAPSAFATTAPDLLRIGAAGQRAAARREV